MFRPLTVSLALCLLIECTGQTTTEDLLSMTNLEAALTVDVTNVTINVSSQKNFQIRGGKAPYSAKVVGTGSVAIIGSTCIFTAAGLVDSPSVVISDVRGRQITIAIDTVGVEIQPNSLPGLALWLKADALNYANGATVTTWFDSSGFGRDFSVGVAGKPTFVSSYINGLPAVSFNGAQGLGRPNDPNINPSSWTVYALYFTENITPAIAGTIFSSRDGTISGYHFQFAGSNQNHYVGYCTVGCGGAQYIYLYSLNLIQNFTWYLAEHRADSAYSAFYLNGTLQSQMSNSNSTPRRNMTLHTSVGVADIGATPDFHFTGKIPEVILFNRALSAGETQGIRCYLKKKYALSFGC